MNSEIYRSRRIRVMDQMAARGGGVAVLLAAPERVRNRDSDYPYRFDSSFWYLTGFPEPSSAIVLIATGDRRETLIFCRPRDPDRELWDGRRYGPEAAAAEFGFDAGHPIEALDVVMASVLPDSNALYTALAASTELDVRVQRWLGDVRAQERSGKRAPTALLDVAAIIDELRLVKDPAEIGTMRRAAQISSAAHERVMRASRPGLREYELEAELLHEFRRHGASAPAYTSIVAAGANACVLHHAAGDATLRSGELCLVDAGCEFDGYASDVTRTFPIDGRFRGEQRAVYELVLAAQKAALAALQPGAPFDAPHVAATRVIAQGLIDLGLLSGAVEDVIAAGAHRQFFMHRTSHWLGLDVHDVGDYRESESPTAGAERPWRRLAQGMTLTIEPGVYLRPAANVPERFQNIGVRIEDDAVVTAGGHELLSTAPKRIDDIEALMRDQHG
jgi:Xaa-Pro aminopeptidase